MKKNNKNKKNAKKVTPVAATATPATPVTATAPVAAVKRGRGRPSGTSSLSLVSLQSLVDNLPSNSQLPVSNSVIKSLGKLGIKIPCTAFNMKTGLSEVVNVYKKNLPASNVVVQNLNETETVAPTSDQ